MLQTPSAPPVSYTNNDPINGVDALGHLYGSDTVGGRPPLFTILLQDCRRAARSGNVPLLEKVCCQSPSLRHSTVSKKQRCPAPEQAKNYPEAALFTVFCLLAMPWQTLQRHPAIASEHTPTGCDDNAHGVADKLVFSCGARHRRHNGQWQGGRQSKQSRAQPGRISSTSTGDDHCALPKKKNIKWKRLSMAFREISSEEERYLIHAVIMIAFLSVHRKVPHHQTMGSNADTRQLFVNASYGDLRTAERRF